MLVFVALHLRFVDGAPHRIPRHGHLAFGNLLDHFVVGKILDDVTGIHAQRAQGREPCIERGIVNPFRMEFEFDPLVDAHLRDPSEVAGAPTESQAVQGVRGAPVFVEGG